MNEIKLELVLVNVSKIKVGNVKFEFMVDFDDVLVKTIMGVN